MSTAPADSLRTAYDALPYRNGPIRLSHPARTGAIARLLGMAAQFPEKARVLELGCAEGLNLLPLAAQFPKARLLGVDFSAVQIATAERLRDEAGLANASFLCADLRAWEPGDEKWDYVIAQGVYSWVPDDVRDRLPALCAAALAPEGVAFVSHNNFPGWGLDYGLRAFLLDEAARATPDNRWPQIQRVLAALHTALKGDNSPHATLRRGLIAEYLQSGAALLFHDQLSEFNTPVTVTQFIAHMKQHGLAFLSPADFCTAHFNLLPAERQQALAPLEPDFERAQAYMDALYPRRHRTSLLVRPESLRLPRSVDQHSLRQCAFRFRAAQSAPRDGAFEQIMSPHGVALPLSAPLIQAAAGAIHASAPRALGWEDLIAETTARLQREVDPAALTDWLYAAFTLDLIDVLLTSESPWLTPNASEAEQRYAATLDRNRMPQLGCFHEGRI